MRKFRLVGIVAMLASLFAFAGGAALAGPAAASNAGGGQTCQNVLGFADLGTLTIAGNVTNCGSNRDGQLNAALDLSGGASSGTIHWATGNATSLITIQLLGPPDLSGGTCPPDPSADLVAQVIVLVSVGGGPYEGTSGVNLLCASVFGTSVTVTNFGPFHI